MKIPCVAIGVSALLGIGGVACGGDGGAPNRADFIAEADDICREYVDRFEEINADAEDLNQSDDPDPALVQDFLQDILRVNEDAVAEIRDLSLPEGDDGDEIDAALDAAERGNARAEQMFATQKSAMEFFAGEDETPDPFAEAEDEMTDAGFKVCFSGEED